MRQKKLTDSEELIYFGAFRYALGRRSYMPDTVSEEIMKHAKEFTLRAKTIFVKETSECLAEGWYGDACDKTTWSNFLNFWQDYQEDDK